MNALAKIEEEEDNVVSFPREALDVLPKGFDGCVYIVVWYDNFDHDLLDCKGNPLRKSGIEAVFSNKEEAITYVEGKDPEYKIDYEIEEHVLDYVKGIS